MCCAASYRTHAPNASVSGAAAPGRQQDLAVPLTVFIAEDDKAAVSSLAELLESLGGVKVVGSAGSEGAAADWLFHRGTPTDILIADLLLLPGGSGFNLIRHARSLGACRKVVVYSSFITPVIAEKCRKLGADVVFLKSQLDELLAYVRAEAKA